MTQDYWVQTGKKLKGNLELSKNQQKHMPGWKTWEY